MKLLLDTHALLWWWSDDPKLSAKARRAIANGDNEVWVSAASVWEIATKTRLGKLPHGELALAGFDARMQSDRFQHLATTWQHCVHAGGLPMDHRDPFDRMLAAQAELENASLVTIDPAFAVFATRVFW